MLSVTTRALIPRWPRFTDAFVNTLRRVETHPLAAREYAAGYRRIVLVPFPYMLVFEVGPEDIYVAALLHSHRDPDVNETLVSSRS